MEVEEELVRRHAMFSAPVSFVLMSTQVRFSTFHEIGEWEIENVSGWTHMENGEYESQSVAILGKYMFALCHQHVHH